MFRNDRLEEVVARRAGRIAFGVVLIVGALALVNHRALGVDAAIVMITAWLVAFWAGALVRDGAMLRQPRHAESLFAASIVVPSVGVSLMLPLLIHLPVVVGLDGLDGFNDWVMVSLFVTVPSHLVLAILAGRRGARLVAGLPAQSIASIFLVVVVVSCIPFIVLVIPPLLTMVTGLPFIAVLQYQQRVVEQERALLGAEATLPRAVVCAA